MAKSLGSFSTGSTLVCDTGKGCTTEWLEDPVMKRAEEEHGCLVTDVCLRQ